MINGASAEVQATHVSAILRTISITRGGRESVRQRCFRGEPQHRTPRSFDPENQSNGAKRKRRPAEGQRRFMKISSALLMGHTLIALKLTMGIPLPSRRPEPNPADGTMHATTLGSGPSPRRCLPDHARVEIPTYRAVHAETPTHSNILVPEDTTHTLDDASAQASALHHGSQADMAIAC
jgi:hypothetical protein